ncbi:MAG: AarF/UbiB family protein, partial [Salinisphaera sp.]|nr:AarF/UbiB family protein [Salinisphaera sp.]
LARLVPRGVQLGAVMHEVRDMIYREVDYVHEARMTGEYRKRLAGDERFVVPEVFPEYSTDTVLTTSFEAGEHVRSAAVQGLPQPRRNRLALNALHLFFEEFFDWARVQTDPHFGNYRVRLDEQGNDRLVLLDFGAVREFEPAFLDSYLDIVGGAYHDDPARIVQGAIGIGLLRPQSPQSVFDAFAEVGFLMIEPFSDNAPAELVDGSGAYDWGASDLPWRVSAAVSRAAISRWFRVPPREIVFLHRRLGGVFVLLAVLRAQIRARPLLADYLERERL